MSKKRGAECMEDLIKEAKSLFESLRGGGVVLRVGQVCVRPLAPSGEEVPGSGALLL